MPQDSPLPFNLLVGPLLRAHYVGEWLGHPQVQVFTAPEGVAAYHREVMDPRWYTFPEGTPAVPYHRPYTWADLWAQLPANWTPDLLIWWGFYFPLPTDFERCPCPLVIIAADWHVHLPAILDALPQCEQLFGDRALLQALQGSAHTPTAYWPSYGWEPALLSPSAVERDLAVSFVGNLQPATYAARNRLLQRVAALAGQHTIWIGSQLYNHDYAALFARSRIVFNHSLRGEMNMRAYEAAASGALLFIEDDNLEVRDFLPEGCVLYNADNLEALLHHYLQYPAAAEALAERGRAQVQNHTYTAHFADLLATLSEEWDALRERHARRQANVALTAKGAIKSRLQHALSLHFPATHQQAVQMSQFASEQALEALQRAAWEATALAHHAISWLQGPPRQQALNQAVALLTPCAEQALALRHNLAWLLLWSGQPDAAGQIAVTLVNSLCQPAPEPASAAYPYAQLAPWTGLLLPLGYTSHALQSVRLQARFGHEPAALEQARRELLLWNSFWLGGQAFAQLGQWAQAQEWLQTAVRWRPDLPEPYPELTRACLQQGHFGEAEAVMRQGLAHGALYPALQLGLIRLLGSQGRFEAAHAALQQARALAHGPDARALQDELARLQRRLGL